MKQMLRIVVLTVAVLLVANSGLKGQFFGENSYTRISIGLNLLSAISEDPAFASMGPSSKMKLPSLRIESDPLVIDGQSFSFQFSSGMGLYPRGFRYKLSEDTVLAIKESGASIYGGIGFTYNELAIGSNTHPLSLYLYGFYRLGLIKTQWVNDDQLFRTLWDEDDFGYSYGLSTRIYFRLWEGITWNIDVFHAADYIMRDYTLKEAQFPYRNLINSVGISFSYASGEYAPWRRY
jgi:hypothetical protein